MQPTPSTRQYPPVNLLRTPTLLMKKPIWFKITRSQPDVRNRRIRPFVKTQQLLRFIVQLFSKESAERQKTYYANYELLFSTTIIDSNI